MGFRDTEGIRLLIEDGLDTSPSDCSMFSSLCQCRICHEEEEESSTSMESPCGCSGTLKFAHRECIQRWCDEKGAAVCEICLQKFQPGYTVVPKKAQLVDVVVTIRESLEVSRLNHEPQSPRSIIATDDGVEPDTAECNRATPRSASCCRSVAVTCTIILLLRHLLAVLTVGADQYAFTLLAVFMLRATGILIPFYFVMRMISAIQHSQRQYQLQQLHRRRANSSNHGVAADEVVQQHTVQIH